MVCTANYEARKFGVRAAMPGFIARKLCPQLVFVKPNFSKYTAAAEQAREVFASIDPNFVSRGLDEASLDATAYCARIGLPPDQVRFEMETVIQVSCIGIQSLFCTANRRSM
jgi:DNA polymerase kappa